MLPRLRMHMMGGGTAETDNMPDDVAQAIVEHIERSWAEGKGGPVQLGRGSVRVNPNAVASIQIEP